MELEVGDLFIVTRGPEIKAPAPRMPAGLGPMGGFPTQFDQSDDQTMYDPVYDNKVFIAGEVCGSHVAAVCVYSEDPNHVGTSVSLNMDEIEVMTITERYLKIMLQPYVANDMQQTISFVGRLLDAVKNPI